MTDALGWPRAVVFDLDGTLVDSVADIASALNATLCRQGLPPFSVTEVRGMMGGGLSTLAERALSARAAAYVPRPAFVSELTAAY